LFLQKEIQTGHVNFNFAPPIQTAWTPDSTFRFLTGSRIKFQILEEGLGEGEFAISEKYESGFIQPKNIVMRFL